MEIVGFGSIFKLTAVKKKRAYEVKSLFLSIPPILAQVATFHKIHKRIRNKVQLIETILDSLSTVSNSTYSEYV